MFDASAGRHVNALCRQLDQKPKFLVSAGLAGSDYADFEDTTVITKKMQEAPRNTRSLRWKDKQAVILPQFK